MGLGGALSGLLLSAALAGCSTLHLPGSSTQETDKRPVFSQKAQAKRAKKAEPSWWSSWFGPKDPPRYKSVKEWMERTERIKLEDGQ